MIPFDFEYCRAATLAEAAQAYAQLDGEGKSPLYYAGGSEVITLCRAGAIQPGALIDIKNIPECKRLSADSKGVYMGAACTLNEVKESRLFGPMRLACGRIADHSNQCRITLGGNLCGTILYRETSLPLLLCDAKVTLHGPQGERTLAFHKAFDGRMRLEPGEMVVQVHIPPWALQARHAHVKRTRNDKIDYPLVTLCALWKEDRLRIAFSGLCPYPFRSEAMEMVLNDQGITPRARAEKAASMLPKPPLSTGESPGDYRLFVFKNSLETLLEDWQHGTI